MPAYEADLERFEGYDAQVLGISVDSVPCNTAWAKSFGGLSFDLLSDFHPKGEVAKKYGAYRDNDGISERALFVVDKEGKLAYKDIHDISDQPDNEELFEVLRQISARARCAR
jgi:peroxiredoxin